MLMQPGMGETAAAPLTPLALLSRVSRALTSSGPHEATLQLVSDLVAGTLAEGCVLEMLDEERVLVVSSGPAGVPELLPPSNLFVDAPRLYQARPRRRTLDFGETTFLDVPIVAREQFYGVLRLVGEGTIRDEETRLCVAEEIALRIAATLDSAHARAREHRAADALQRALLPERLPTGADYAFNAAYLPAMTEAVVGGDWYDAFVLPDGRIALSIGDVAGHGLSAATTMGEVRHALRASALDPRSPAAILERANAIINMRPDPVMVTAIFGIFDPATSLLTYATAGHPAPILGFRDGWCASLPAAGVPLGIGTRFESFDWTFTIAPGSLVVFFTDGLLEHGRDVIAGEARILGAVSSEALSPTANPASSLHDRVFGDQRNADDVATLTLVVPDRTASGPLDVTCSAIPLAAPLVRHLLIDYARRNALSEDKRFELITAVGEAVANAAEHAYTGAPGLVHVAVNRDREALRVVVEDAGRWKPTVRREERGRGLRLMRALSSGLQIQSDANGTSVRFRIPIDRESSDGIAV
jgi:anti-sigma regulatory factor (Ser/Thr protein kinase)